MALQRQRPEPGSWTYDDLEALPDDGRRYEIVEGELWEMTAPTWEHAVAIRNLITLLIPAFAAARASWFTAPFAVFFPGADPVQPDLLAMFPGNPGRRARRGFEGAPDFVVDAARAPAFAASGLLAHRWLVPNPPFHPRGDFGIDADGFATLEGDGPRRTYANLALVHRDLVHGIAPGTRAKLVDRLVAGIRERRITAEAYDGQWENVGTPAQLAALDRGP